MRFSAGAEKNSNARKNLHQKKQQTRKKQQMKLHELHNTPGARKKRKIIGRGDGSGQGGTAGRGHKGEKARSGVPRRPFFEGGQMTFFRRLPKKGFKSLDHKLFNLINVSMLDANFAQGDTIDEALLQEKGLIGKKALGLKVLGDGEITKAVTVKACKFSASAKAKIEASGGKCELIGLPKETEPEKSETKHEETKKE